METGENMSKALLFAVAIAAVPVAASAQDARDTGAAAGAAAAGAVGGAVGAVVGAPAAVVGGVVGGVTGALAPRFHHYVVEERVPSYAWVGHPHVVVGDVLPDAGVTYYPVPPEYGVTQYRYTVIDNEPILVDPSTRRVVEVIP
jgi:hypothetical protein